MAGVVEELLPWIDARKRQALAELATAMQAPETIGPNLWGALKDLEQRVGVVQSDAARERAGNLKSIMYAGSPEGKAAKDAQIAEAMMGMGSGGIGSGALAGIIKGPHATSWNPKVAQAADILEKTRSPQDVHAATGLWRPPLGKDQAWRGEISDSEAQLTDLGRAISRKVRERGTMDLVAAEDFLSHPELYKNYPDIGGTEVEIHPGGGGHAEQSVMNPREFRAVIGANQPTNILLHELTHIVQAKEGFNPGGASTDMNSYADLAARARRAQDALSAYTSWPGHKFDYAGWADWLLHQIHSTAQSPTSAYLRIPGEAEARNTVARRYMDPAELATSYPYSTYDVPLNEILWKYWNDWGKQP